MTSGSRGRVLVTGGAGFVGGYLVRALLEDGWQVTATAISPRDTGESPTEVKWIYGDLREPEMSKAAVQGSRPDAVIHLAAISHLPTAAADPAMAWDVNVTASVRLLDVLAREHQAGTLSPRVLVIGSSEQYGRHDPGVGQLTEMHEQMPRTVYAVTKAAQEMAAMQVWRSTGLDVVAARAFNHSGAGQNSRFLLPALVSRALALKSAPAGTPLILGNTSPIRDFLHVSDVVAAYIELLRHGTAGLAYNVASGVGRSVHEVAERILSRVGLTARLQEDPALVRPVDVPSLVGDPSRLRDATGWQPRRSFDELLDDLLNAATY